MARLRNISESVKKLLGSLNEVLSELGLRAALSTGFSQSISHYAMFSSLETRFSELSVLLGLENDSRIEKYLVAAKEFQKNWLLKNSLFFGIRRGKISEQIVSMVASPDQKNKPTNPWSAPRKRQKLRTDGKR